MYTGYYWYQVSTLGTDWSQKPESFKEGMLLSMQLDYYTLVTPPNPEMLLKEVKLTEVD